MAKNITFNDIAKYTGFSKTTISRYFNNPDSLTPKNQKIISDALEKLDYKENKVARILANGKTEFVGIIVPNLYMHYYAHMLEELLASYEEFGYKFLVFTGNEKKEIEEQYIQELLAYKIEGLIVLSHTIPSRELASYNLPVVTIEREDQYTCSVNTDNYLGAVQAASLLYKNNCDILILINSKVSEKTPGYKRIQGFVDICKEYHQTYELIQENFGMNHEELVKQFGEVFEYLEEKYSQKKKGIFISNDTYANIILNLIIRKYGRLPEDYRIVGFDDSPIASESIIPISTVGQQIDKIAHQAMELLAMQIEECKTKKTKLLDEPVHQIVSPVLMRRETTD
jgi:LacI family sucrose operon transcriptional repressor